MLEKLPILKGKVVFRTYILHLKLFMKLTAGKKKKSKQDFCLLLGNEMNTFLKGGNYQILSKELLQRE